MAFTYCTAVQEPSELSNQTLYVVLGTVMYSVSGVIGNWLIQSLGHIFLSSYLPYILPYLLTCLCNYLQKNIVGNVCTCEYLFVHVPINGCCRLLFYYPPFLCLTAPLPPSFILKSVSSSLSWFPLKFSHLTAHLVVYTGLNLIRCWIHLPPRIWGTCGIGALMLKLIRRCDVCGQDVHEIVW